MQLSRSKVEITDHGMVFLLIKVKSSVGDRKLQPFAITWSTNWSFHPSDRLLGVQTSESIKVRRTDTESITTVTNFDWL